MSTKKSRVNIEVDPCVDRRLTNRQSLELLVSYIVGSKKISDFTYDLSSGGMFIETQYPLSVNEKLIISFELPHNGISFELPGIVCWLNSEIKTAANLPLGMGVKFLNLDDLQNEKLKKAVEFYQKYSEKR